MPWKDKDRYKSESYREYMRVYQREWHQRHKVRRIARVHERKQNLSKFYNEIKVNAKCIRCGETHPATLQFHHLNPEQKDFNLAEAVRRGFSKERIQEEMAKCEILCANCHAKEHFDRACKNGKRLQKGLAAQFLEVEQSLTSVHQEILIGFDEDFQAVKTYVEICENSLNNDLSEEKSVQALEN